MHCALSRTAKGQSSFIVITVLIGQAQYVLCIVLYFKECQSKKTIQEMTEGGFGFHRIYKNIIRTIEKADIERIKREVLQ